MSHLLKYVILRDRNGDWESYLQTFQGTLPIFRECDCVNYFRCMSWYLENMRNLSYKHPEIYRKFMKGNFVARKFQCRFHQIEATADYLKRKIE